jgi:hypothetical protein
MERLRRGGVVLLGVMVRRWVRDGKAAVEISGAVHGPVWVVWGWW